ncbi:alpha/beta fold hydrolase [Rhodospirillaceae bacterium SYSU D60014]|uniref:alpha/beta fold hydrolase n=1 Tax=Virgifigura deserti TaxID=2268457 RepID=UPI000E676228
MAVALAAVEQGAGPPVVILHGLFGAGRNWTMIAKRLAATHRVYALDLRNHGASPWADSMRYAEMAEDVRAFLQQHGMDRATLLGHSMGGKVAMLTALCHGGRVDRLVVVDIAPVSYPPTYLPYVRAMRAVDLSASTRRSEIEEQLRGPVRNQMVRLFLLQNLVAEDGRFRWRVNLPVLEEAMAGLSDFPELPSDRTYGGPALFIAGGRSAYVGEAQHPAIKRLFPSAEIVTLPEAGHWIHAEQPEAFLEIVRPFLGGS